MNSLKCWTVVLIAVLLLPSVAVSADEAREAYESGLSCLAKNDYDAAITAFTEALRLDPKNVDAYYNRGRAFGGKTEFDEAIAEFTVALRLDPKYAKAYLGLGVAYYAKNNLEKAFTNFTAAIRLDPTLAKAYNNRGLIFNIEGDHGMAIADYTEAIRVDPKFVQAYFNRGRAFGQVGDKAKADEDFAQAKKLGLQVTMKILFLHGWQSTPGGVKPTYLKDHGHEVLNPALPDDDFDAAVRIAQAEFDQHQPDVVVGSSRGGAVAMNINAGSTPLVLLCPAWKRWGTARTVKPGTVILHSGPMKWCRSADSVELVRNSGLPRNRP